MSIMIKSKMGYSPRGDSLGSNEPELCNSTCDVLNELIAVQHVNFVSIRPLTKLSRKTLQLTGSHPSLDQLSINLLCIKPDTHQHSVLTEERYERFVVDRVILDCAQQARESTDAAEMVSRNLFELTFESIFQPGYFQYLTDLHLTWYRALGNVSKPAFSEEQGQRIEKGTRIFSNSVARSCPSTARIHSSSSSSRC